MGIIMRKIKRYLNSMVKKYYQKIQNEILITFILNQFT